MGQIAEDMIDGTCCELCGSYFQDPVNSEYIYTHDIPTTCKDCWKDLNEGEKKNRNQAKVDTI